MIRSFICLLAFASALPAVMKVMVTVVEQKTGRPVDDLKAEDFTVIEDKIVRKVEGSEFSRKPVDTMLLVDTSLVGGIVQPIASSLIGDLREKEQMAIIGFDHSADLIQDFTSSKQLLGNALAKVKYGNTPKVLDALFAAMDGGFEHALFRHVILLVTTGLEGHSRVTEKEVIRLARKNSVSIYPVYATGSAKGMFEELARKTGGASFQLRDLQKNPGGSGSAVTKISDAVRGFYTLTITGNLGLSEKVRVEIKGREKQTFASIMPID